MKKYLYMLFLLLSVGQVLAQRKFNNSQWEAWEQATLQLEMGNFDTAIGVYGLYPRDQGFILRLKQAQRLKNLYLQGTRLQNEKKYSEAIAIYKTHRDFGGIGSLSVFEKKIDECLKLLGNTSNSRLKNLERQLLAAEYSYKGLRSLVELDVHTALKSYELAKKYGTTASPILKEKYREDLRMIQELISWQQLANSEKNNDLEIRKSLLQKYRDIKGIPVLPRIETQIQIVVAEVEGRNILLNFAQNCETNALIYYIQEHQLQFTQSEDLIYKLNQYKSIRSKIDTLSTRVENSETVKSAFTSVENMTKSFDGLPDDIKKSLERCLNLDKQNIYLDYSRQSIILNKFDLAESFLQEAKTVTLPDKQKEIKEWEQQLKAQKILFENKQRDSLETKRKEEIFSNRLKVITKLIEKSECKEAKIKYAQLENEVINNKQARELSSLNRTLKSCNSTVFRFGLIGGISANKPLYKVISYNHVMNYGLAANGGIQLSFRDENSPVSLSTNLEYFYTDYNSLNSNNQIIENFRIDGSKIGLNINLHLFKSKFYIKGGPEALIPFSYKYKNYSAVADFSDRKQLKNLILSGTGGLGYDNGKLFIEMNASYGIDGIYNKNSKNISSTSNNHVSAIFRKAGINIGLWLFK